MRSEKASIIEELRTRVKDSAFLIVADYQGLNVAKTEELKRRLRGVKAQFQVIQNRMFKRVAGELSQPEAGERHRGPVRDGLWQGRRCLGGEGSERFHQRI